MHKILQKYLLEKKSCECKVMVIKYTLTKNGQIK